MLDAFSLDTAWLLPQSNKCLLETMRSQEADSGSTKFEVPLDGIKLKPLKSCHVTGRTPSFDPWFYYNKSNSLSAAGGAVKIHHQILLDYISLTFQYPFNTCSFIFSLKILNHKNTFPS